MRFRIGSALVSLALAVSMTAVALAQADDGTPAPDGSTPDGAAVASPVVDQPVPAVQLFVHLVDPTEEDITVPLETAQLTIQGVTLPGAVVSVDGDIVDVDDQGNFAGMTSLDEGANEIEVVASDGDGNQVSTTLFVVRGE